MVDYTYLNKPTKIRGHKRIGLKKDVFKYDSRLEAKVGVALIRDRIKFKPHVTYRVYSRTGIPFQYTIDFDLEHPTKIRGVSELVDSIEAKGVLKNNDFDRKDAFEYSHDRNMWIATPSLIEYWIEEGITKPNKKYYT